MNKKLIIFSWALVVLCMMLIFYLSSQQAKVSNAASKGIVKESVEVGIKVTKAKITETAKQKLIEKINSAGREYMHAVVFLILGLLVQNAVSQSTGLSRRRSIKTVLFAFTICVIYGISDEIHQLFVPGRAFQVSDLLMDSLGSIIGIFIVYMLINKGRGASVKSSRSRGLSP